MKKRRLQGWICGLCALILLGGTAVGACAAEPTAILSPDTEVSSRFLELFREEKKNDEAPLSLIPGGGTFGIRIQTDGVLVEAVNARHLADKIQPGDRICTVDGEKISSVSDLSRALSGKSESVTVELSRGDQRFSLSLPFEQTDAGLKLGISVKDTVCGIGTVSFIDPETGRFGGLGHGISGGDGADLVPIRKADVTEVILGGVGKGEAGSPGELHGVLKNNVIGSVRINDECGVFGTFGTLPKELHEPMPVATREEVEAGPATILCTVKNGECAEYTVMLSEIDTSSRGTKSFTVKVTDPALIAMTGGIVRGMSGSPILQNGKLVGAVTHVTVADPTVGFGIFLRNMLDADKMPAAA